MKKIILIFLTMMLSISIFASNLEEKEKKNELLVYTGYRYAILPDFIIDPFYENFESVSANSFYAQFIIKKQDFAYSFELDYMSISAPSGYWNQEDKPKDYLIIDIGYLNLGINFNWYLDISPKFSFISSFGVGVGILLGEIDKYDTNGERQDPKRFKKDSKKPPVFGHLLMNFALQYEVYKIKNRNPIFIKLDMGFKDLFYGGVSLGYQFK